MILTFPSVSLSPASIFEPFFTSTVVEFVPLLYVTEAATASLSPVVPAADALLKNPVSPIHGTRPSLSESPMSLLKVKSQSSLASVLNPRPSVSIELENPRFPALPGSSVTALMFTSRSEVRVELSMTMLLVLSLLFTVRAIPAPMIAVDCEASSGSLA